MCTKCEICGHEDHIVGVASIPGWPISICWCAACLAVQGTVPLFVIDEVGYGTYYEPATDTYMNKEESLPATPISFKPDYVDEHILATRKNVIAWIESKNNF